MAVIVNGDGILTGISSLATALTDITSGRGTVTGVATVGTLQLGAGVSISSPRSQQAAIFTNNTEFFTVDDAGRVGVGTITPNSDAHPENEKKINVGFITAKSIAGDIDARNVVVAGVSTFIGAISGTTLSFNSGTVNTCATFTSTDSGAVINLTDNSARSSIEQNGTDLKIISDTDAGDDSSTIKFLVDNSTKMTLNSSGNLGINEVSPLAKLHVKVADSGASAYAHSALFIEDSDHTFIDIMSGTSGSGGINFGDSGNAQRGVVEYNHSSDYMRFITAQGERLRITSGGQVNIGTSELDQTSRLLNVYGGATRCRQTSGGNTLEVFGHSTSGQSYGLLVNSGTTANDYSARFRSHSGTVILDIKGDEKVGIMNGSPFNRFCVGGNTFNGGHGMYANNRVGMSNHGNLTGLMLASTYNDAGVPEYGLVFVQGPDTSNYNVWSISPDGPAKGNSLSLHYGAQNTNIHILSNRKFEFDGDGDFRLTAGNVDVANGYGIDFSATGDGNGTDSSELLADYEEGSWTPTNTIGLTLVVNNPGYYTKVGKLVTVWFDISFRGYADSAQCSQIQGLPYAASSNSSYHAQSDSVWYSETNSTNRDYDDANTLVYINGGDSTIRFWSVSGGHLRVRSWAVVDANTGRRVRGTLSYLSD